MALMVMFLSVQIAVPPTAAPAPDCRQKDDGEIVVCAPTDQERFRLRPLLPKYETPTRAEATIPGVGKVAADAEQGRFTPQLMLRLKIPF